MYVFFGSILYYLNPDGAIQMENETINRPTWITAVLIICIGPFPYYMDNETHEPED
jgi:hypothetical protein